MFCNKVNSIFCIVLRISLQVLQYQIDSQMIHILVYGYEKPLVIKFTFLFIHLCLQPINFGNQEATMFAMYRKTIAISQISQKQKKLNHVYVCNLYQSDSFFSSVHYDTLGVASYKQACVTRFTMKWQFMKSLIKREKIKRWNIPEQIFMSHYIIILFLKTENFNCFH